VALDRRDLATRNKCGTPLAFTYLWIAELVGVPKLENSSRTASCSIRRRVCSSVLAGLGRLDDNFAYLGVGTVYAHLFRSRLGQERGIVEYQVRQTTRGAEIRVCCIDAVDTARLARTLADDLCELVADQRQRRIEQIWHKWPSMWSSPQRPRKADSGEFLPRATQVRFAREMHRYAGQVSEATIAVVRSYGATENTRISAASWP
jgi:hypothetical protein